MLERPLAYAKRLVRDVLKPGALSIDATCGNGHDTAFMAELVGPLGHVYGFDVQARAIDNTRKLLAEKGLNAQVSLFECGHEKMEDHLPEGCLASVSAVMFNLGYLPGSDKRCTTRPDTTLAAVESALPYLAPGGLISLMVYTGHPGGSEEAEALRTWAAERDQAFYRVLDYRFINQRNNPPWLLAIEKIA